MREATLLRRAVVSAPAEARRVVSSKTRESFELESLVFDFLVFRFWRRFFTLVDGTFVEWREGNDCWGGEGMSSVELCDGDVMPELMMELSEGMWWWSREMDWRRVFGLESSVHCDSVS